MTLFEATTFDLADRRGLRVFELLLDLYGGRDGVDRLLLHAQLAGVGVRGVNRNQSLDLAVAQLLQSAAAQGRTRELIRTAAEQNGAGEELLRLLAVVPAQAQREQRTWQDDVTAELAAVGRSRAPVLIAVESAAERLEDADLLRTERHLTVTLTPARIAAIRAMVADVVGPDGAGSAPSVQEIVDVGVEIWSELVSAEPRLPNLLDRVRAAGPGQPVAWCGRAALLADLQLAVLIAHTGAAGDDGLVSLGGAHYFMPTDVGRHRPTRRRSPTTAPTLRWAEPTGEPADPEPAELADSEMVLLVDRSGTGSLRALAAAVRAEPLSPTRALLAFAGTRPPDAPLVADVLETLPFLSLAPVAVADRHVVALLRRALRHHATGQALACVVAAVRAGRVRQAVADGDPDAVVRSLLWSTWSWVGLPLFPPAYDELPPAAYPHLMDLRSVAADDWYLNRQADIPDDYTADALSGVVAGRRFHLYLSGAGGTGKSCFLRYVHDQMAFRPTTVAVFYRVDAPSSSWENINDRVREATLTALRNRPDVADVADAVAARLPARPPLGVLLNEVAARLREVDPDFEVVVFIDQLERTFESGDEPNLTLLNAISRDLVGLLKTVGIDRGVRVFIASRKQYLPDFLRSSRTAQECNLEFNVLQSIENSREREEFVQRVVSWARQRQLVSPHLVLQPEAQAKLAEGASGHPLNMMLTLIQLLSVRTEGNVAARDVDDLRLGENLFALDLRAAERDDLDWHFLLAMAHARTEIVRIEEVWWRLRMVDPQLTRRVDELGPDGILERLWLFGLLGRTLHARAYAGYAARYVEFFHANLRDHLLRSVMARGGGATTDVRRRRTGTPPAWRALDRLAGYARDWEQMQQLLPADDVRVLMEHRSQVIERTSPIDATATPPFHLLFLRESDEAGRTLSDAAMQCFAFSALVHDDQGTQTFADLFDDVDRRVRLCGEWLPRCTADSRPAVLAHLVEEQAPSARQALTRLVLDEQGADAAAVRQEFAALLAEPLYAARYRNEIVAAVLRAALARAGGDVARLPKEVVPFVVAAVEGERNALVPLLAYCVARLGADTDPLVRAGAPALGDVALVDDWTGRAAADGYAGARVVERAALPAGSVLALVVGSALGTEVHERLAGWSAELRRRMGVPLPALRVVSGETEPHGLELRSSRGRIAANVFYADRVCVDMDRWAAFARVTAHATLDSSDLGARHESVLWLPPEVVARAGYPHRARSLDEAVLDWLEEHCRRSFELLMDTELFTHILRGVAATAAGEARLRGVPQTVLRDVVVDLVEEGVPLGPLGGVVEQLARLVDRQRPDYLTQKVREALQTQICRRVSDDGQVTTLLLDDQLEQFLVGRIRPHLGRQWLALSPEEAEQLNAATVRAAEKAMADLTRPPLVLVTDPMLRYLLARQLWRFDTRHPVLSYTELDFDVLSPVAGGQIGASGLLRTRS